MQNNGPDHRSLWNFEHFPLTCLVSSSSVGGTYSFKYGHHGPALTWVSYLYHYMSRYVTLKVKYQRFLNLSITVATDKYRNLWFYTLNVTDIPAVELIL